MTMPKDSDLGQVGLREQICPQICILQRCGLQTVEPFTDLPTIMPFHVDHPTRATLA